MGSEDQDLAFPAFLTPNDPLGPYSEAAFRGSCFESDRNAKAVQKGHLEWQNDLRLRYQEPGNGPGKHKLGEGGIRQIS
jgi:hypothetical protein